MIPRKTVQKLHILLSLRFLKILFFFIFFFLLGAVGELSLLSFFPNIPFSIFLGLLFGIGWIYLGIRLRFAMTQRDPIELLERNLFGKDLFILKDFLKKPSLSVQEFYGLSQKSLKLFQERLPKELVQGGLLFLLIVIEVFVSFVLIKKVNVRYHKILKFYQISPLESLPKTYTPGKPLDVCVSHPLVLRYSLQMGETLFLATNGETLEIPTDENSQNLELKLRLYHAGFSRLFRWKVQAQQVFALQSVRLTVYGILDTVQYSGLRDLDLWKGSRVNLKITMNQSISNVSLKNSGARVKIHQNTAQIRWRVHHSVSERVRLWSEDGQEYKTEKFVFHLKQNQPPQLKLLFPKQTVPILGFPWKVHVIMQADDDLGVGKYILNLKVSNQDPEVAKENLWEENRSVLLSHSASVRIETYLKGSDFILLPNDVIQAVYTVQDLLGKKSAPVRVTLIYPDSQKRSELREKQREKIQKLSKSMSKRIERNQASGEGSLQKNELKKNAEELLNKEQEFKKLSEDNALDEIQKKLEKLDQITQSLKHNLDMLSLVSNSDDLTLQPQEPVSLSLEQLEEIQQLLSQLKSLQKSTDWFRAIKEAKDIFTRLSEDKKHFDMLDRKYQESLKRLETMVPKGIQPAVQKLLEESQRLDPQKLSSFESSKETWKKLQSLSRQALQKMLSERMNEDLDLLSDMLDEGFLRSLVYHQLNQNKEAKIQNEVGKLKALHRSAQAVNGDLHTLFGRVFIDSMTRRRLLEFSRDQNQFLDDALTAFRDHHNQRGREFLSAAAAVNARLYLVLLDLRSQAKQAATQQKKQGGKKSERQSQALSLQDLIKMQKNLSELLRQMLQKNNGVGLKPSERAKLQKLSELQSRIRQNLDQLLKKGGKEAMSGGQDIANLMDELQKQLQSYKVDAKTLKKSRKIEEKLKKSLKSLKSKGLSQKRKSEQAGNYEVSPPPELQIQKPPKKDWQQIPSKGLSEYYRRLIQRIEK